MLQKFKAIEEIGRFSSLTHKAEPLSKLSLIFGRNGFGKSTLCSILRSAADGNANHIKARRRLGAIRDSRVESTWAAGATFAYSGGKWNGCPGKIHIFDQEFVSTSLHVADSVTRDNKRRLLPVVLGDRGVALAEKVVTLDKELRDIDENRKQQARIILARCKGLSDDNIGAFCRADIPADLDNRIEASAKRVELVKQAAVVKIKRSPPSLPIGDLDGIGSLLAETIDGVSEHATRMVKDHVDANKLGDDAYAWLEHGTAHSAQDHCPYCAQDTKGVPLVAAYKVYFSGAFKALQLRIEKMSQAVEALSPEKLEDLLVANDADFTYWAKLCDISPIPALSVEERRLIADALTKLKGVIGDKRKSPLEDFSFGGDTIVISKALTLLANYNARVTDCRSIIDTARAETSAGDAQKTELSHAKWLALGEKSREPVKAAVAAYLVAEAGAETLRREKAAAQAALTKYTATTMAARQEAVNALLFDFGANFRMVDAKTNFVGREPNTEFAIEIGAHKVKAGDKSDTEPSFKTMLSAGDKTTLALAFFIAQIEADPGRREAIIVFDDPFNSQDMDRRFQTSSHIRAICDDACQTIVLSHDPRFLQLIERNAFSSETRTFQLQCSDSGEGSLSVWSSADELKSLYVEQAEMIREFATHQKLLRGQSLNNVKQAIRPFLEDHLRLRFPGRFREQAQISEMADVIRNSGAGDPLASHIADLIAINEYTRPNMHGGGDAPTPGELRAHCKKVVSIVGSY